MNNLFITFHIKTSSWKHTTPWCEFQPDVTF